MLETLSLTTRKCYYFLGLYSLTLIASADNLVVSLTESVPDPRLFLFIGFSGYGLAIGGAFLVHNHYGPEQETRGVGLFVASLIWASIPFDIATFNSVDAAVTIPGPILALGACLATALGVGLIVVLGYPSPPGEQSGEKPLDSKP